MMTAILNRMAVVVFAVGDGWERKIGFDEMLMWPCSTQQVILHLLA